MALIPKIDGYRRNYQGYDYVLASATLHTESGEWRSLNRFFKDLEHRGDCALLINLKRSDGLRKLVMASFFSPKVVVNGMSSFSSWWVLLLFLVRPKLAIYLHDTDYMLDAHQRQYPLRYRVLARLLKCRLVFCVSEAMAELYRERFGARSTAVVYELTNLDPEPCLDPGRTNIVMVGGLGRRKGWPLFGQLADLAAEHFPDWRFHWVGPLTEADLDVKHPHIQWWGWQETARPFILQADAFFLASVDDPQPLACLEALTCGRRCVVYRGTGSAEVVAGLSGCRIYEEHEPESAMQALSEALSESVSPDQMRQRVEYIAGFDSFKQRMDQAFARQEQ